MKRMKGASLQPTPDCPSSNTGSEQLVSGDDPMLRSRQFRKHMINVLIAAVQPTRSTFGPVQGLNVDFARGAGSGRR